MLDYEGLTFQEKENVFKFIESSEMQKSKRPTEIKDASEAFLKGMTNDHKKTIPKQQASYLHQKVRKLIFGPSTKDASLLNELCQDLIKKHPNSCIKYQVNDQNQLTSFLFSSETMKSLYQKYNDVVLIDSTYKTNKYKMPLLVFAAIIIIIKWRKVLLTTY